MTTATAGPTKDPDLHETIAKLEPLIRTHGAATERGHRLADPVLAALRDGGFFRMLRPRTRGGLEMDPVAEFEVGEALARVDSAAAWNVQVCNASELYGGWFPDESSDEIFGACDAIVAGSFHPHRRSVPVDGGYRVSGRTPFNSNCHGATWLIGLADVFEGGSPRLDASGRPTTLLTALPARELAVVENWDTLGMRGTGSHDVDVREVFVPEARAVPFGPLERPSPAYDNALSRLAIWVTIGCHASVGLGVAQAAIDGLVALGERVPAYTERSIRDRSVVQMRLARAEGKLSAARAFLRAAFGEAWGAIQARGRLDLREKARCQLAASTATLAAAEVVDLVHACVGTAGIRADRGFEKCFRDVHVITQHAFLCESRLEAVGQIMLGLEPDWGFFRF